MEEAKWRFASNGNAGYTGINDSGIETFSAQVMHSLVRETIQNALDARKDPEKPIEVEFKEFSMSVEDFPGRSSFSKSIHACLDDNEDEDARKFFQQAVDKIDGKEGDFSRFFVSAISIRWGCKARRPEKKVRIGVVWSRKKALPIKIKRRRGVLA